MPRGMRLEGLERLVLNLGGLEKGVARRVLPKAARAGGAPALTATRRAAPKASRMLSRSLALVIRRGDGRVVALVGQLIHRTQRENKRAGRSGGLSARGYAPPVHLVDQPVKAHAIAAPAGRWLRLRTPSGTVRYVKAVRHRGHRGARFLQRAADETRGEQQRAFEAKAITEIEKEAAKART